MFTGIIQRAAPIADLRDAGGGRRLTVAVPEDPSIPRWPAVETGESIAVSGVCLTAADIAVRGKETRISFDIVAETVSRSTLGRRRIGDRVNLERSLGAGDLLGGHYVTGHVDGVGRVLSREPLGSQVLYCIGAGADILRCVIAKGSIAVDGVSLTVVDVDRTAGWFTFAAVPFTLRWTTLGEAGEGTEVNLETDAFGKWVLHGLESIAAGRGTSDEEWRRLLERSGLGGAAEPGSGEGG
ncbi:MAG: riboflavin synthase [Planctomycetes bacterium]|nr:riboflavin synthase [Planctomycetota bacterium]